MLDTRRSSRPRDETFTKVFKTQQTKPDPSKPRQPISLLQPLGLVRVGSVPENNQVSHYARGTNGQSISRRGDAVR